MLRVYKDRYHTFCVLFGSTRTGKTVQYRILNYTGVEIATWTATGVYELGYGAYGVRLMLTTVFTGYIQWRDVTDGNISTAEPITVEEDALAQLSTVYKVETGRWKILNNQMIFYDTNGTTPLLTFDLKDSAGAAAEESIYERAPV